MDTLLQIFSLYVAGFGALSTVALFLGAMVSLVPLVSIRAHEFLDKLEASL